MVWNSPESSLGRLGFPAKRPQWETYTRPQATTVAQFPENTLEVGTHLGPPSTQQLEAWSQDTFLPWRWKCKLGCGIFASSPNKRFVSSVKKIVHFSPCDKIISYPLQFYPPFHQPPPSFCKNLKSRCPPRLPASIS